VERERESWPMRKRMKEGMDEMEMRMPTKQMEEKAMKAFGG